MARLASSSFYKEKGIPGGKRFYDIIDDFERE
jgi:hypothetical protein